MPQKLTAFPPIEGPEVRVLILGSMPSQASLEAQRYYAHKRNQFWRLVSQILGEACPEDYGEKQRLLLDHGIALWDVLKSCSREGSADSAIRDETANDFNMFFSAHPEVHTVLFNGGKARELFRKNVLATLESLNIQFVQLPSTSPANAAPYEEKLRVWRKAFEQAGIIL